jgi:hypothetical protein
MLYRFFAVIFVAMSIVLWAGCRAQYPKKYFKKAEKSLLKGIPDILYCYTERINKETSDKMLTEDIQRRNQNIDTEAVRRVRTFMRTHEFDEIMLNKEQEVVHLIDHNFQVTIAFLYYYGKEIPKTEKENDLNGKIVVEKLSDRWYLKITELEGI